MSRVRLASLLVVVIGIVLVVLLATREARPTRLAALERDAPGGPSEAPEVSAVDAPVAEAPVADAPEPGTVGGTAREEVAKPSEDRGSFLTGVVLDGWTEELIAGASVQALFRVHGEYSNLDLDVNDVARELGETKPIILDDCERWCPPELAGLLEARAE